MTQFSYLSYLVKFSCLIAGTMMLLGCGGEPAKVPTSFAKYNAKDGTFECDSPEGWEISGGGKHGPVWAKFVSGSAEISIRGDVAGSLMADAGGGRHGDPDMPDDLQPVHALHVEDQERFEEDYGSYKEIAGPLKHDVSLGPGRISEFTAASSFGTALHGYRATILGHEKRVVATSICPETEWAALKPAFDQVLASLDRGVAE